MSDDNKDDKIVKKVVIKENIIADIDKLPILNANDRLRIQFDVVTTTSMTGLTVIGEGYQIPIKLIYTPV